MNTHGLRIDEIAKYAAHAEKPNTHQTLNAVVMTLPGLPAETTSPYAWMSARLCLEMLQDIDEAVATVAQGIMDTARTVGIPGSFKDTSLIPKGRVAHMSGSSIYCTSLAIPTREAPSAPRGRTRRPRYPLKRGCCVSG